MIPMIHQERVLKKIEGLSALTKNDSTILPSDVVQAVFRALFLSREEKKSILHYVSQAATATITVIRVYVETRLKEYELMASTLGSLSVQSRFHHNMDMTNTNNRTTVAPSHK